MRIVGFGHSDGDVLGVHTIDIWYSRRRAVWVVERLDESGDQVGSAYRCASEEEASACLNEWLRTHDGTQLSAPHDVTVAEMRILKNRPLPPRRAA